MLGDPGTPCNRRRKEDTVIRHQGCEAVHVDDREWETIRWPGQSGKMLFHPRPERPTEPNAGLVRYEPGSHHPFHRHDFAQIWYILEGRFRVGDEMYGPAQCCFIRIRTSRRRCPPKRAD